MTDLVSQPLIEKALRDARGDLFVASQLLGCTALKLDRAIRASPDLQALYLAIEQVAATDYERKSAPLFEAEVSRRMALYRSDALDALHDLATMPVDKNSAQNQVKLLAATRLAGPQGEQSSVGDIDLTLRQLNEDYHRAAPRIKSVRERVITFDNEPREISGGEKEITS